MPGGILLIMAYTRAFRPTLSQSSGGARGGGPGGTPYNGLYEAVRLTLSKSSVQQV